MRFFPLFLLPVLLWSALPALAAPPAAPSHLVATAPTSTTVRLDWQDHATDEAGFEISYRVGTSGSFTPLFSSRPANETFVTITGAAALTTYQFQIRAFLNPGPEFSSYEGPATVTTPPGLTSASFRSGYQSQPFSFNLASTHPAQVTGYAITALPDGLSLDPATGTISGTPTTGGRVSGQVTITHAGGATATGPLAILIFINPPALLPPTAGAAPPDRTLAAGTLPTMVPLAGLFTDPDVSSAARLTTDLGDLDFAFYPGSAPRTVANFLGYLGRGDFSNTMFHRSVPGFIIQGGAFRADATASAVTTHPPVVNEPGITNRRGTVAMAKLGGNPDSATNQFFINLANNAGNLDNQNEGFTVFARIAGNGMAIADAIAALPARSYASINGALTDTPVRGTPPATYDPGSLVRTHSAVDLPPLSLAVTSSQPAIATASITGTGLSLAPLAPGTATITLTATDLDGQTAASTFTVTVLDTYQAWAARQSFALPTDSPPGGDPDRDGKVNLIEYALGSSPLTPDPGSFEFSAPGPTHRIRLRVAPFPSPRGNVIWEAEFSDNPAFSPAVEAAPLIHPVDPLDPAAFYLDFTDPDPGPHPRRFGRLKITLP